MTKLELTYISLEGGIIYSYKDGFLDLSSDVLSLPAYNTEGVLTELVPCKIAVCLDGEGFP